VSWAHKLVGTIHGGPVIGAVNGRRLLVVGTEAGVLYGLDPLTGHVAWSRSLSSTIAACGGTYGITSTPTIDERNRVVYVAGADGFFTAVDFATGTVRWRVRVLVRPTVEHVWSGVRLVDGSAYVAVASYCDLPDRFGAPADGYLLRVDLAQRRVTAKLDVVPGPNNLGGIWGWGGVSVDLSARKLYTSTGNSMITRDGNLVEDAGHAERVLELTLGLRVTDSTPPPSLAPSNLGDEDYGATPLLFHPKGCPALVAANSKNGHSYIWRRGALDGGPVWDLEIGPTQPNDPFLAQPTFVPAARMLVVAQAVFGEGPDRTRGMSAYYVGPNCTLTRRWNVNIGGGHQSPPIAVGKLIAASAPVRHRVVLIDAVTGYLLGNLDTGASVYAPLATDGVAVYAAAVNGVVFRLASPNL
jgi:hypothetical protein